jgi:hypothetical protein
MSCDGSVAAIPSKLGICRLKAEIALSSASLRPFNFGMSIPSLAAAMVLMGLTSCAVQKMATPAPSSDFLKAAGAETNGRIPRLPFDHSWRSPVSDPTQYKYIVVKPVSISWLRKEEWGESKSEFVPDEKVYLKESRELSNYWTKSLKKAFSSPICSYYITDSTSQAGTLILEVALTEVNYGIPPAGVGSMAFEARVKDADTGKYIATAADRRATISKIVDFNKDTYTRANKEMIDQWSQQLMEASNKELFPKVGKSYSSPL